MKIFQFFLLLMVLPLFVACKAEKSVNEKPNVILVITDDQGYGDLACHGNPIIQTPNIDQFHSEGVRFNNFHVGTTCTPTRGGLLTGRNANRNGTWHTIGGCSILNEREVTLADVFKENGYATAMFGKWHLGDNYPFRPHDRGFNETFYHAAGGVGQTPDYWLNDYFDDTYFRNGTPEKAKGYCTDVWFDEAEQFVSTHKGEPFFMYLSLNAPHGPFNVPESYASIYDDAPLQDRQKNFYGMITQLDERFGQLRQLLKDTGIEDNTLLVFMTDNGTAAGYWYNKKEKTMTGYNANMRGTKGSQYDGGHRVPFIVKWPKGKIEGGKDVNALAAHVDLLPTLMDVCKLKAELPMELDGTSIKALLLGDKANADFQKRILVTDTQRNQWPEKGRNSCVMQADWRLVNGDELYDVSKDSDQKNNIAEQHPEKVNELSAFYDQWWSRIEKDFKYPVIKLGVDQENPAHLTCHDMHSEQNIPWNQNMIRKGISFDTGYFLCEVMTAGKYKFSISRYPKESGLAMNATVAGVKATKGSEELVDGVAMHLTEPFVKLNEKTYSCKFNEDNTAAEVIVDLEAGALHWEGGFMDQEGNKSIAYYYVVERL